MMQRKITIVGPLDDEDVERFMFTLRACEIKNPDEKFMILVEGGEDKPIEDLKEWVAQHFPAVRGTPFTVETYKKD